MGIGFVFVMFFIGLVIIVVGGDWFIDSSIWLAEKTGISFGIVGATIISLATTLPELLVSAIASHEGLTDMSIGNSLGSIICNIAIVIGICSLIKPLHIKDRLFNLKGIMLLSYLSLFYIFAADGLVSHGEGKVLLSLVAFFILVNFLQHRISSQQLIKPTKHPIKRGDFVLMMLKFIIGGFFVVYGANTLVDSGVEIANIFRIPKQIISLTLLALGTSLPELVASLSATLKDQPSISIGNIIGANILNLTIVMGISAIVSSSGLIVSKQTLFLDIPMAFLVTLVFILSGIFFKKISRLIGLGLLVMYIGYLTILL